MLLVSGCTVDVNVEQGDALNTANDVCIDPNATAMICGVSSQRSTPFASLLDALKENRNSFVEVGNTSKMPENLYRGRCVFNELNEATVARLRQGSGTQFINIFRFGLPRNFESFEIYKLLFPLSDVQCNINPKVNPNDIRVDRFMNYLDLPEDTLSGTRPSWHNVDRYIDDLKVGKITEESVKFLDGKMSYALLTENFGEYHVLDNFSQFYDELAYRKLDPFYYRYYLPRVWYAKSNCNWKSGMWQCSYSGNVFDTPNRAPYECADSTQCYSGSCTTYTYARGICEDKNTGEPIACNCRTIQHWQGQIVLGCKYDTTYEEPNHDLYYVLTRDAQGRWIINNMIDQRVLNEWVSLNDSFVNKFAFSYLVRNCGVNYITQGTNIIITDFGRCNVTEEGHLKLQRLYGWCEPCTMSTVAMQNITSSSVNRNYCPSTYGISSIVATDGQIADLRSQLSYKIAGSTTHRRIVYGIFGAKPKWYCEYITQEGASTGRIYEGDGNDRFAIMTPDPHYVENQINDYLKTNIFPIIRVSTDKLGNIYPFQHKNPLKDPFYFMMTQANGDKRGPVLLILNPEKKRLVRNVQDADNEFSYNDLAFFFSNYSRCVTCFRGVEFKPYRWNWWQLPSTNNMPTPQHFVNATVGNISNIINSHPDIRNNINFVALELPAHVYYYYYRDVSHERAYDGMLSIITNISRRLYDEFGVFTVVTDLWALDRKTFIREYRLIYSIDINQNNVGDNNRISFSYDSDSFECYRYSQSLICKFSFSNPKLKGDQIRFTGSWGRGYSDREMIIYNQRSHGIVFRYPGLTGNCLGPTNLDSNNLPDFSGAQANVPLPQNIQSWFLEELDSAPPNSICIPLQNHKLNAYVDYRGSYYLDPISGRIIYNNNYGLLDQTIFEYTNAFQGDFHIRFHWLRERFVEQPTEVVRWNEYKHANFWRFLFENRRRLTDNVIMAVLPGTIVTRLTETEIRTEYLNQLNQNPNARPEDIRVFVYYEIPLIWNISGSVVLLAEGDDTLQNYREKEYVFSLPFQYIQRYSRLLLGQSDRNVYTRTYATVNCSTQKIFYNFAGQANEFQDPNCVLADYVNNNDRPLCRRCNEAELQNGECGPKYQVNPEGIFCRVPEFADPYEFRWNESTSVPLPASLIQTHWVSGYPYPSGQVRCGLCSYMNTTGVCYITNSFTGVNLSKHPFTPVMFTELDMDLIGNLYDQRGNKTYCCLVDRRFNPYENVIDQRVNSLGEQDITNYFTYLKKTYSISNPELMIFPSQPGYSLDNLAMGKPEPPQRIYNFALIDDERDVRCVLNHSDTFNICFDAWRPWCLQWSSFPGICNVFANEDNLWWHFNRIRNVVLEDIRNDPSLPVEARNRISFNFLLVNISDLFRRNCDVFISSNANDVSFSQGDVRTLLEFLDRGKGIIYVVEHESSYSATLSLFRELEIRASQATCPTGTDIIWLSNISAVTLNRSYDLLEPSSEYIQSQAYPTNNRVANLSLKSTYGSSVVVLRTQNRENTCSDGRLVMGVYRLGRFIVMTDDIPSFAFSTQGGDDSRKFREILENSIRWVMRYGR